MTLLPLSDSQRRWLKDALNQWQTNETISPEQAQKILLGYEPEEAVELRKNSRLVFVLGGMAILLFGAAIFLVVGHNWQDIPRAGKLVANLGLIGLAHFAAWFFRAKRNDVGLSNILHFLGCLLYGVAIWTIAQAYHISGHYPDGMWWWAIGVLPFVIFGDSLIFHLLYALLLYIWMTMELTGFGSHHFLNRLFWGWVSLPKRYDQPTNSSCAWPHLGLSKVVSLGSVLLLGLAGRMVSIVAVHWVSK